MLYMFGQMQCSGTSNVHTKELAEAFSWETQQAFKQHDVQDLNGVLCIKLEEKMKVRTGPLTRPTTRAGMDLRTA